MALSTEVALLKTRLLAAALLTGFLATFAAPCLAVGGDAHDAMDCCAKMQSSCPSAQIAQACCRAGDAAQHDRDVQATRSLVTHLAPLCGFPTATAFALVGVGWRSPAMRPSSVAGPPLSARFHPLLI